MAKREGLQAQFDAVDISLLKDSDAAEVVLCCEVLEHLERPHDALQTLARLARPYLVASVPREPLWSVMNLRRGKYLRSWGNTPGHVNRWSRGAFVRLLQEQFDVIDVKTPIPWTIALCRSRKDQGVHAAR